ncbi:MAG: adenylate kinase [Flavobacteriales bacterium]
MLNIVLFGPPGAGKGTQSAQLVKHFGLTHLSTGDIFRFNMKEDTALGKLAKSYISKGQLVPDEVTIDMLQDAVNQSKSPNGFIFDGFPRTTVQAEALDRFLAKKDMKIDAMVALEVEKQELIDRLLERGKSSGRADDANQEVIEDRLDVYNQETAVVKEFYEKQDKFHAVDGLGTVEDITERLINCISSLN